MITKEEILEKVEDGIMLFENPDYGNAILGISDEGRVCYSMGEMIYYLVKNEICADYSEAMEYIDYNTIRALAYMPRDTRPIIVGDCY
jgi:hypothetical protein